MKRWPVLLAAGVLAVLLAGCTDHPTISSDSSQTSSPSGQEVSPPASSDPDASPPSPEPDTSSSSELALPWTVTQQAVTLADGNTAVLTLQMTSGRYFDKNSPDYMEGSGQYATNYQGEYVLTCTYAGQTDVFPLGYRTYPGTFSLSIQDYNDDGCPDFLLGQADSDSGNLFRIFTIRSDGTIQAVSKPFFAYSLEFSPAFPKEDGACLLDTYDHTLQQRISVRMEWQEDGYFSPVYTKNWPSDLGRTRSDGVTELSFVQNGVCYRFSGDQIDRILSLVQLILEDEPLTADSDAPDTTAQLCIHRGADIQTLELPSFTCDGIRYPARAAAQELIEYLQGLPAFSYLKLTPLPEGYVIGRADGVHRVRILLSADTAPWVLPADQLDGFLTLLERVALEPTDPPEDPAQAAGNLTCVIETETGSVTLWFPCWAVEADGELTWYRAVAGEPSFFAFLNQFEGIALPATEEPLL